MSKNLIHLYIIGKLAENYGIEPYTFLFSQDALPLSYFSLLNVMSSSPAQIWTADPYIISVVL